MYILSKFGIFGLFAIAAISVVVAVVVAPTSPFPLDDQVFSAPAFAEPFLGQ